MKSLAAAIGTSRPRPIRSSLEPAREYLGQSSTDSGDQPGSTLQALVQHFVWIQSICGYRITRDLGGQWPPVRGLLPKF
jgi:hypothetical protein